VRRSAAAGATTSMTTTTTKMTGAVTDQRLWPIKDAAVHRNA